MSTALTELSLVPPEVEQLVADLNGTDGWKRLNELERLCADLPQITPCPMRHVFTPVPGYLELRLYTRSITMEKGALIFSRIHRYEHPFEISAGAAAIWTEETGWKKYSSPCLGVTMPGTRRLLYILEECVFSTFHVTKLTDPDAIVEESTCDHMALGHMDDVAPEQLAAIQANAMTRKAVA
jgi:hypothetical protein